MDFQQIGEYRLANKELAELVIDDCLSRLKEGHLFGSGWPQSPPRDYPRFRVYDNFTAVMDASSLQMANISE